MFLMSLYAVAITVGLCLYWFLHSLSSKRHPPSIEAASSGENKDLLEGNGGFPSGMHYLKAHKSPRKVQLKEVHHPNDPAAVRVITPEGITLVQAQEKPPKRRPAPPPPPKQPPRRPPPPPPPASPSPPPTEVVVQINQQLQPENDLPPPPLPTPPEREALVNNDEPLPPPPEIKDASAPIYPKNSYMSYRSERKMTRQGFDGKYRRSFHNSDSSVDLPNMEYSISTVRNSLSPKIAEEFDRKHGTTVIFRSESLSQKNGYQKGNSEEIIPVEHATKHNISSESTQNVTGVKRSENREAQQSVPYEQPSQKNEIQNTPDLQKSSSTKGKISNSKCVDGAMIIKNTESASVNDNKKASDAHSVEEKNNKAVDHNQNSVKNNQLPNGGSAIHNGNDLLNRINSSTQTTYTPRLHRKATKTKEELECEKLSREFIHQYGDIALKSIMVPAPQHISMVDNMSSLLNVEIEKPSTNSDGVPAPESDEKKQKVNENGHANMNNCTEVNDNQDADEEIELKNKKEELIASVGKKVESLKSEQTSIRVDIQQNELLGQKIAVRLQELAKPNEVEKFLLHVEEMEKILNLMLSLSGRLARAENLLKNLKADCNSEEKRLLETKRDKLKEQHEDACRLKENIDRRSNQVSMFLHKYLNDEEFANYDHFLKMKTKLIVDLREIDEKINLGEEQLAALSVVAHYWKSANSNS